MIGFLIDSDKTVAIGIGWVLGVGTCAVIVGPDVVIPALVDATAGLAAEYLARLWSTMWGFVGRIWSAIWDGLWSAVPWP